MALFRLELASDRVRAAHQLLHIALQLRQFVFHRLNRVNDIVELSVAALAEHFNRRVQVLFQLEQLLIALLDRLAREQQIADLGHVVEPLILVQICILFTERAKSLLDLHLDGVVIQ